MELPGGLEPSAEVLYNGQSMTPSDDDGCWVLPRFGGDLVVSPPNGPRFDLAPPLMFKTDRDWKSGGRRVLKVTHGYFIVMAPTDWEWKGPPPPVAPASTTIPGHKAHFVYCTGSEDDIGGFGKQASLPRLSSQLLRGKTVFDDDHARGPLFIGEYPELLNLDDFEWVVVGDEGCTDGWRTRVESSECASLSDVMHERDGNVRRHQGWFFIRLYDATPSLVASSCFRHFPERFEIRVDDKPYTQSTILLPKPTGHWQVRLTVVTASDAMIQLSACSDHVLDNNTVLIPPQYKDKNDSIILSTTTHSVRVLVSLPRIWWRLVVHDGTDNSSEDEGDWQATPLRMTRQRFAMLAKTETVLRLRAPNTQMVKCGFDGGTDRAFRGTAAGVIDIPFYDFLDDEVLEHSYEASLDVSSDRWPNLLCVVQVGDDDDPEQRAAVSEPVSPTTLTTGTVPALPSPALELKYRTDCDEYLVRHAPSTSQSWDAAREQGLVCIPGRGHCPRTGSRIWVCIARGYVGVGVVVGLQLSQDSRVLEVKWCDAHPAHRAIPSKGLIAPRTVQPDLAARG